MDLEPSQSPRLVGAVSGLLLAGGESRRMGLDKANLLFGDAPLWKRQAHTLRDAAAGEVMISRGDRTPLVGLGDGIVMVPDAVSGCGPLGGITGALRQMAGEWLMVLAVDLPLIDASFLRMLVQQATASGRGVVPKTASGFEPLAAVYGRSCVPLAEEAIAKGNFAMQQFVARCESAGLVEAYEVAKRELRCFANVNTPAELKAAERDEFGE